jgi:NAD-dependent DNA ligase
MAVNPEDFPEEYRKTVEELLYHRYRYYVKDDPEITDSMYDRIERTLPVELRDQMGVGSDLERSYPPYVIERYKRSTKRGR